MSETPPAMPLIENSELSGSLHLALRKSRILLAVVVFGIGLPMTLIPMSRAVIAGGELTVTTRVKKIAHPHGGVVTEILVGNGTRVRSGQLLIRLDSNVSAASAAMTVEGLDQLQAREARLLFERDSRSKLEFPATMLARQNEPSVAQAITEERRSFELNRSALTGKRSALQEQIAQASKAIGSYNVQADVYRQQEALIAEERKANEALWAKGYTTLQRRNELARAAVGLHGSVASAQAQASQLQSRIAELQQQIIVTDENARREASAELAQVQAKILELRLSNVVAQDTNSRNTIRSPYDGVVDKLAFTSVGGVIPAGDTVMEIVPDHDPLIVTARVSPTDIDQLTVGQKATLRFSAFNSRITPEIEAQVSKIGADRTVDAQRGIAFYAVEIEIADSELRKLGDLKLRPGMPAEAFIKTGADTMLSYLLKPLSDQFARAFR